MSWKLSKKFTMGHKNLSKQLKRVEGEICLAPPHFLKGRPPTRSSVPLRRCSNGTCLSSKSHQRAYDEDSALRETICPEVGRSDRDNTFSYKCLSSDKPFSAQEFQFKGSTPIFDRQNTSEIPISRSDNVSSLSFDDAASRYSFRPRRNLRHISSSSIRRAGILSTIYENLQTSRINEDVLPCCDHNFTSTDISLSKFASEATTVSAHEELTTAATIATDDIFLRTATALDENDTRWGTGFSESELLSAPTNRVMSATMEPSPKLHHLETTASEPVHTRRGKSPSSIPVPETFHVPDIISSTSTRVTGGSENKSNVLTAVEIPPRTNTGISTVTTSSIVRFACGDSPNPSTPSDWGYQKPRTPTGKFTSSSTPPGAPPTSAATSTSDKPPFMLCFRRQKQRPRSIITSNVESCSHQLLNSTSLPNTIKSPSSTPIIPTGSISVHNNHIMTFQAPDINANTVQPQQDLNNNETNEEVNNNNNTVTCGEKNEKVEESRSKQALSLVTALDKKAVEGKAEVVANPEVEAEDTTTPIADQIEKQEEFWNSESSTPIIPEDVEEEKISEEETATSARAMRSKKSKSTRTREDYYNDEYWGDYESQSRASPFITQEKGAIRFHLPGRIQHKTTIKVAHFPENKEKNVTVNLKPNLFCEEDDGLCVNNKNITMMQPPICPPVPPSPCIPPCPYPYGGGYPYSSYYRGYCGGGYPPYY